MNLVKILLVKEFLILKNFLISFLLIICLMPLFLYLFISIPLSMIILNTKPVYINLSASGIWIVSTLFFVFIYASNIINKNIKSDSFLALPINSWQLLISKNIFLIFLGFMQLLFSILLTSTINQDYISFLNILVILFLFLPNIVTISSISIIINFYFSNKLYKIIIKIIIFMVISFGYGSFIPLNYFPDEYFKFINLFPVPGLVVNSQKIISGESIMFSYFLISIFVSICMFFISLFILEKKMIKDI